MMSGPADLFSLRNLSSFRTNISVIKTGSLLFDTLYKGDIG